MWIINEKGTYGTILNAVNEVAVHAYLKDEIPFLMIEEIIDHFMETHKNIQNPSYEIIETLDKAVRYQTREYIEGRKK